MTLGTAPRQRLTLAVACTAQVTCSRWPRSAVLSRFPAGTSGIGSGLFNACRQIGTATGLAILGSIGAGVTLASWHHQASTFPAAGQRRAAQVGTEVAGGQVHAAAAHVGGYAHDPAVASFLQGFEFALFATGAVLAAAGIAGFLGLRHLRGPAPRQRQLTDARLSR
jgi:hypothetical protein